MIYDDLPQGKTNNVENQPFFYGYFPGETIRFARLCEFTLGYPLNMVMFQVKLHGRWVWWRLQQVNEGLGLEYQNTSMAISRI